MFASQTHFNICDHIDKLTPAKGKNRYICPACNNDNLTIDATGKKYQCWNGCSCKEIRDAIAPWEPGKKNSSIVNIRSARRKKSSKPRQVPLPESIQIAKADGVAIEPATVTKNQRFDGLTSRETRFNYADDKWVIRNESLDANGQRTGKKRYSQHHSIDGIEQFQEKVEDGVAKKKPFKGDAFWPAYRESEADLALQNGGNCLLVVEGEPCTDVGWELGYAAITFQGSGWNFQEGSEGHTALKCLRADGLVIWPDADKTGFSKAQKLAEACAALGIWTVQLDPAAFEVPEKGDIVDAIASLGSDEVRRRIEAQLQEIVASYQPEIQDEEVQYGSGDGGDGGRKKAKLPPADIIAEEIAEEYRDRLIYNNENAKWHRYEADAPGVWAAESEEYIEAIIARILKGKGLTGWNSNSYISNVMKAMRHILIERKWIERPANELMPFQNGVLEVATGKLLPHSPGYRFTWCMPRPHNPLATDWTGISNWLDSAVGGNAHLRNVLLAFASAVLKGRGDLQKALHLIGFGGSGKGTFIRLLVDLVGQENVHTTTLKEWCNNRFEAAQAYRKRLVLFPDEDKRVENLGPFKSLTGGDWLRAEEKNEKPFKFRFDGMAVINSNFPVFSGDNSSGIARRMIAVPFEAIIPQSQRRDLNEEFQPELAAFTNYLLSLPDDWVERVLRGVSDVPQISLQFWENKIREDSIAGFLNDRLILDPTAQTGIGASAEAEGTLYHAYVEYCRQQGNSPKANKNFSPDLLELCRVTLGWKEVAKIHGKTGKVVRGLRLRVPGKDDHIGTWDFELREKCDREKNSGDGSGDGLVTGRVTGQNQDTASISGVVTDKATIGCENNELKLAVEVNQGIVSELNFQPDAGNYPSPSPNSPCDKGFDPPPAAVTDPSLDPSPSKPSDPIAAQPAIQAITWIADAIENDASLIALDAADSLASIGQKYKEEGRAEEWEMLRRSVRESFAAEEWEKFLALVKDGRELEQEIAASEKLELAPSPAPSGTHPAIGDRISEAQYEGRMYRNGFIASVSEDEPRCCVHFPGEATLYLSTEEALAAIELPQNEAEIESPQQLSLDIEMPKSQPKSKGIDNYEMGF